MLVSWNKPLTAGFIFRDKNQIHYLSSVVKIILFQIKFVVYIISYVPGNYNEGGATSKAS